MFKKKSDCVNLLSKQHTTVFLIEEVNNTVVESSFKSDQIKAAVTDSPLVMLKIWRILKEVRLHVIVLSCTLHAADTLTNDICKAKPVRNVVNSNCEIVNFFTSSHVWFTWSKECIKENVDCQHSLGALCETRWYYMTKVCLGVSAYEQFFIQAKAKHCTSDDYLKIRTEFHKSITRDHFTSNDKLIETCSSPRRPLFLHT